MTTPTVTEAGAVGLTKDEAEAIARARAALSWIRGDDFPWPDEGGTAIRMCAEGISDCLDEHEALRKGDRHPESVFPDLGRHQDDALAVALERVTQDMAVWTGAAIIAIREKCGDAAAALADRARLVPVETERSAA